MFAVHKPPDAAIRDHFMPRTRPYTLAFALLLGGCAAAVPGYVPSTPQREKMLAAAPRGGGFDDQGTYHLTEQEQKLDCKGLTGSVTVKILQMRDAGNRQRPSALAATAQTIARPLKGTTTHGVDIDADLRRDRARLETLNRQLSAKGCRTFDIEAELKPGNSNPPRPTGEPRPKAKASG
jgi:hypothetical protein